MSTAGSARRNNGSTALALGVAARTPSQTLGRGFGVAAAAAAAATAGRGGGHGVGLPPPPRSRGRGGAAATTLPAAAADGFGGGVPGSSASMGGFPFAPACSPPLFDVADGDPSSPSWGNPSGGFMSFLTNNLPHNSHFVGAMNNPLPTNNVDSSPEEVGNILESENDTVRTEKRILWNVDEDVRLMSAWIEHSTDSTCGADKGGGQYWGEVVETYNKTTSPLRRRSVKQCKDRWHKINRWTDLFECAYAKARRVFTSGYSTEMWLDAAHKFYVDDNKNNKDVTGPYTLMDVWKICRNVPKWKTYNENLKNACKRKSFHLEGESEENEDTSDEMPKRPMGQKAAKKAALAAKIGNVSNSSDDGRSKESPIELDKFDRYSKFQETNNEKRMKMLDRQEKIACDKLEATRVAQLTAQDYKEGKKFEKETKMMETYNNLASQDTSSMSDEERAQRLSMMKKLVKALFPEAD
ncbi:unnamed protein product [Urochloa decumbens]|uniref:Myb-like domain-containing protein n=1 Tax=Urochloa decumbens TaxID=240449 RepID=A0ABC8YXC5_9POAL